MKVSNIIGEFRFHLRFSDRPDYFVQAYFRAGQPARAADAYAQVLKSDPQIGSPDIHHFGAESYAKLGLEGSHHGIQDRASLDPANRTVRGHLMRCYVATGDVASYRPLCMEAMSDLDKNADANAKNSVLRMVSLMPGVLTDYSAALSIAKKLMDEKSILPEYFQTYGALLFRAKQYQSATNFLKRAIENQKGKQDPFDWVFLAMARHRLKLATDKAAYNKANTLAKEASSDWELNAEIHGLLEEARQELVLP